jgi:spermidine/putrescine transport system ATP-binding protein
MKIAPDNIHLIPYDNSINHYDGVIVNYFAGKGLLVEAADFSWYVEPDRIFPGATVEDGYVMDQNGRPINVEDVRVEVYIAPSDIKLSDDAEEGLITGNIVSFIYVDDHYMYTVRTKSEEDYVVHDVDLWNQEDFVSLIIPEEKVKFRVVRS